MSSDFGAVNCGTWLRRRKMDERLLATYNWNVRCGEVGRSVGSNWVWSNGCRRQAWSEKGKYKSRQRTWTETESGEKALTVNATG